MGKVSEGFFFRLTAHISGSKAYPHYELSRIVHSTVQRIAFEGGAVFSAYRAALVKNKCYPLRAAMRKASEGVLFSNWRR